MPKVKLGKETVKFLAIFDHMCLCASSSFSLLPSVKSPPQLLFAMNPQILSNTPLSGESKTHNE